MQLGRACCVPFICCCRRQREVTRQNEMAERERQTQELLKSCEVSVLGTSMAFGSWGVGVLLHVHSGWWLLCCATAQIL